MSSVCWAMGAPTATLIVTTLGQQRLHIKAIAAHSRSEAVLRPKSRPKVDWRWGNPPSLSKSNLQLCVQARIVGRDLAPQLRLLLRPELGGEREARGGWLWGRSETIDPEVGDVDRQTNEGSGPVRYGFIFQCNLSDCGEEDFASQKASSVSSVIMA